jgi:hypothetical protein
VGPRTCQEAYKEKHLLPLPTIEIRFLGRPVRSVVSIPTELIIN